MKSEIKLSILDQSIVRQGSTPKEAIEETIATAKLAERLGYHRFWISEHYNAASIAGSTPEVLMVKLANDTSTIRIGSGGIMLPNHSALKVAENFRMLETLFPGRIDLGMGRAPGTDRITSSVLNPSNDFSEDSYLRQLTHLQHYFHDTAGTQYGSLLAVPQSETVPMQWILSSSGGSSRIAAKFGAGLAIARFINGYADRAIVDDYRRNFRPSAELASPQELLAISVLCADTEEKALRMRKLMDYRLLQFEKGNFDKPGSYESIRDYQFTPEELQRIRYNGGRVVSGTPEQVKEQLTLLADELDVQEVMAATMTDNVADRLRSFELLAEVFEINKNNVVPEAAVGSRQM
ncbi:LLM class flavin-dependent oxidoreductase [Segetibacter sp. 3557_3]|uniref:LLM class flavin-dependent oxidoreductase n=1 Tax=Segetibacter sp. 3557_3 TaxID=2547429 RepID=UPI00105854A4|nr:LLM class flavin-dependent oxidoreductase [Segetibacter sp. 3557_3]TDH27924.1 LLM class flavin-dependent oxidoreductase [Segetibacter sp. 3557_3]